MNGIRVQSRDLMSVVEINRVLDCFTSPGFMGLFCGMSGSDPNIPQAVNSMWRFEQAEVDRMTPGCLGWGIYAHLIRPWEKQMLGKAQVHRQKFGSDINKYLRSLAAAQVFKYAVFSEHLWELICKDSSCYSLLNMPTTPFHNYNGTYGLGNIRVSADLTSFLDGHIRVPEILKPNQVLVLSTEAMFNFGEPKLDIDYSRSRTAPTYMASLSFGLGASGSIHELDI